MLWIQTQQLNSNNFDNFTYIGAENWPFFNLRSKVVSSNPFATTERKSDRVKPLTHYRFSHSWLRQVIAQDI